MKRKGIQLTIEQANEHQVKHGFPPLEDFVRRGQAAQQAVDREIKKPKKLRVGGRTMNQTEREFDRMLSIKKMNKQILDYRFEGIVLPWGDGMRFKSDFSVKQLDRSITLIEVKGEHIWKHAIVRFKGCRAEWKNWFDFEFWQRSNGRWNQLV